jgi:hypothetical protein
VYFERVIEILSAYKSSLFFSPPRLELVLLYIISQ